MRDGKNSEHFWRLKVDNGIRETADGESPDGQVPWDTGHRSPNAQFGFGAGAHIFPGDALRLPGHHPSRSSLDLCGPGRLDFSWVFSARIKACEQFSCDICTLCNWQGQGVAKNFLCSGGHTAILDPDGQPNTY